MKRLSPNASLVGSVILAIFQGRNNISAIEIVGSPVERTYIMLKCRVYPWLGNLIKIFPEHEHTFVALEPFLRFF